MGEIWKPTPPTGPEFDLAPTEDELEQALEEVLRDGKYLLPIGMEMRFIDGATRLGIRQRAGSHHAFEDDREVMEQWHMEEPIADRHSDAAYIDARDRLVARVVEKVGAEHAEGVAGRTAARHALNRVHAALDGIEWQGPHYKPGRSKKEWMAAAKQALAAAVAAGDIPDGLVTKFSMASHRPDQWNEIYIKPWVSSTVLSNHGGKWSIKLPEVLLPHLLPYCRGKWIAGDGGLVASQVSARIYWNWEQQTDDRTEADLQEELAEQIAMVADRLLESFPGIGKQLANDVATSVTSLVNRKGHRYPSSELYPSDLNEATEDEVVAAFQARVAGDPVPLQDLVAACKERSDRASKAKREEEKRKRDEQRQRERDERAAPFLPRITTAVDTITARFPSGKALNIPTPAGCVVRLDGDELLYARSITFGSNYRGLKIAMRKGRITTFTDDADDAVADLEALAADPLASAKAVGLCMFCCRELTDDNSRRHGYGPDCANKHGMPWRPAGA